MASTSRQVADGPGAPDGTLSDDAPRAAVGRPPDASSARLDLLPAIGPVVVMLVAGAVLLTTTWHPVGDYAIAEIIVRHATTHPPLFGPYSATRPYHHPLPLVYALAWGPYELFGRRSSAQLAATVWFNGVLLGLIVWLTARRRALGLGLALLAGIAVFATNSAPGHLSIPWNPFFAFIPTIVLAVAAWRCALGDRWSLPLAAGLATWSVGAHIAYAPTVVGLSAVAIVGITVTTAHRHGRAGLRGLIAPAVWSVALVATLSSPALLDLALHGTRSNPWRIVHWLRHPDGPTIPTRDALKAFLGDLSGRATWATGKRAVYPFLPSPPTQFPVLLVPGAAALVLAVIRRAVDEIVSFVVVGVALLTTLLGLLHLQSQRLVDWYLLPLHAMALVYAAVTAWSLCRSVSHVVRPRLAVLCGLDPRWVAGAGTALATLLAVVIVPNLHEEATTRDMHRAPQALVQAVERQVPRSHTILLDAPYQSDGYYSESLALELERAGYTVRYPPRYAYLFSEELTTLPTGRPVTVLSPTLSKSPPAPPASGAVALGTAPPGTKGLPRGYGYTVWRLS